MKACLATVTTSFIFADNTDAHVNLNLVSLSIYNEFNVDANPCPASEQTTDSRWCEHLQQQLCVY